MTRYTKTIHADVDLNGNVLSNVEIQARGSPPEVGGWYNEGLGAIYYDTEYGTIRYYDGTAWREAAILEDGKVKIENLPMLFSTDDLDASASDTNFASALLLKNELDVVDADIAEEREARIAADTVLQENIDAEATARAQADTDEATARQNADTTLQSNIDTEATARATADTTLQANIDSEASVRASADDALRAGLDDKTDITEAIPVWTADRLFYADSSVVYAESVWISLQDNNMGHVPGESETWWVEISGSGGGGGGTKIKHKTIQFGNGTDTTYVLTHNLATYDFIFSIRTNDDQRHYIMADVYATSNVTVTVNVTTPPGANGLIINLIDVGGTTPGGTNVEIVSITEASDTWTYINATNKPVFVQAYEYVESTGLYDEIRGNIDQPSSTGFTPVTDVFDNEHSGEMTIVKSDLVYTFENQSTWIVNHNLSEMLGVQCYTDEYGMIQGNIDQDGNTVTVAWNQPMSGYLILMEPSMIETIAAGETSPKVIDHTLDRFVAVQVYSSTWGQMALDVHQNGTDKVVIDWSGTLGTSATVIII